MVHEMLMSIGIMLMGAVVFVGVVLLIIDFVKNQKSKGGLDTKTLWTAYLYLMSFVSLGVGLMGAIQLLKAGSSYLVAPQFAYPVNNYQTQEYVDVDADLVVTDNEWAKNMEKIVIDDEDYYFDSKERQGDLINGASLFVSMLLLFVLHRSLSAKLDKKDAMLKSLWSRFYNFSSLVFYGVLSVIIIPSSIYSVIRYYVGGQSLLGLYNAPMPGAALAGLIVIVPTWLIFLSRVISVNANKK